MSCIMRVIPFIDIYSIVCPKLDFIYAIFPATLLCVSTSEKCIYGFILLHSFSDAAAVHETATHCMLHLIVQLDTHTVHILSCRSV